MKTSQAGIDLITEFEGFRAHEYLCPAGKPTIGYGHVVRYGERFDTLSDHDAMDLLLEDLSEYESRVLQYIDVDLTQGQFDALVSFCYNLGPQALKTSTLCAVLNRGKYEEASNEFKKWVWATTKDGRVKLPGLIKRREAERLLFLS